MRTDGVDVHTKAAANTQLHRTALAYRRTEAEPMDPKQSRGKRSTGTRRAGASGQRRRWATIVHHGTNGHVLRKVLACTDRT